MLLFELLLAAGAAHVLAWEPPLALPAAGLSSSLLRFLMSASRLLLVLPGSPRLSCVLPLPLLAPALAKRAGEAGGGEGKPERAVEDLVSVSSEEQLGDVSSRCSGLSMLP
jgi:hypothetical protein